jgi:hypothetical protein
MKDHELIGRYLARRLTEAEELMIETRIIQDPAFRNEVELTQALKEGMRELEHRGEMPRLLAAKLGWQSPKVAVAAVVATVAAGLVTFSFYQARETLAPAPVIETLRFEAMRGGAEADVTWVRGDAPVLVEMRFDVGPEPAPTHRVTISRLPVGSAGPVLVRVVSTSPEGEAMLVVDGGLFPPGDYEIRLDAQPVSEAAIAVSYTFSVGSE